MYKRQDLLNLLNFLFLRADSHAQYEIRVYAETMLETVKKWVPITHAAFLDYRVGAVHVSAKGKKVIQKMIKGEDGKKYPIFGEGGVKRTAEEFSKEFLGEIPIDPEVGKSGDQGKPIVESNPDNEISKIYLDFAKKIKANYTLSLIHI